MKINGRRIADDEPTYLIAELGINHNGDVSIASRLIEAAANSNADAVKFQVGDPRVYVNKERWDRPRETPWGVLPYIEYREWLEFSDDELMELRNEAGYQGLDWFASPLDTGAVDRLEALDVPCYKIASPKLTNTALLEAVAATGKPVIASTGMSTEDEIEAAHSALNGSDLAILHCTSTYPTWADEVNLAYIQSLKNQFPDTPIGFSDHTVGVPCSVAAVAIGARIIERHLTLSRAMWGSDHGASLEPQGFAKMTKYIRTIEEAMGDGVKKVYEREQENRAKFRVA